MNDTPHHITQKLCELMKKKSPTERYMMSWSMYETSKFLITHAIMEENPQITKAELKKKLFLKFYCDDFNEKQKERILAHLEKHYSHEPILADNSVA